MDSSFKTLVAAIIAIIIIAIFLIYFSGFFKVPRKPDEVIREQLEKAETKLGQYYTDKAFFKAETEMHADPFDSQSRTVTFVCNHPRHCCPKGVLGADCHQRIMWDNSPNRRFFSFREDSEEVISARCRFEEIYICKVYIGEEPAQVALPEVDIDKSDVNLAEGNEVKLSFQVKNVGKQDMSAIDVIAKLYRREFNPHLQKYEYKLVSEKKLEPFSLHINASVGKQISIEIPENGTYKLNLLVRENTDETNFVEKEFEINAFGKVVLEECIPGEPRSEWISENECKYFFPCDDCITLEECERKWRLLYNIPDNYELTLEKVSYASKTLELSGEGERKDVCTKNCYTKEEVLSLIGQTEKPFDIFLVIDGSGSMSDDIDETITSITNLYETVRSECIEKLGTECLRIGAYVFEGYSKKCLEENNPLFQSCLNYQRQHKQQNVATCNAFQYDSFNYVLCNYAQSALIHYGYTKNRNLTKDEFDARKPPHCISQFAEQPPAIFASMGDDFGYQDLTSDFTKIADMLNDVISAGGQEAWADVSYFALSSDAIHWRDDAEKIIIVITDAYNNGSTKTLTEVAELAREKNVKIFSLAAKGCDMMPSGFYTILANYLRDVYGYNFSNQDYGFQCPEQDLQSIAAQTGGRYLSYANASELPSKILEIITTEIINSAKQRGLKLCEEGMPVQVCTHYCILPWQSECGSCSCAQYYDKTLSDYSFMDVEFVLDLSGSMADEFYEFKNSIADIINTLDQKCSELGIKHCMKVGIRYVYGTEKGHAFPSASPQAVPLTGNLSEVTSSLTSVDIAGGADVADPWAGISLLALGSEQWSAESKRYLIVLTDAPNNPYETPYDNPEENYRPLVSSGQISETIDDVIASLKDAANRKGVKFVGIYNTNISKALGNLSESDVQKLEQQMSWLSSSTGGVAIPYSTPAEIKDAIISALTSAIEEELRLGPCSEEQCILCRRVERRPQKEIYTEGCRLYCNDNLEQCYVELGCDCDTQITKQECIAKWQELIQTSAAIEETPEGVLAVYGTCTPSRENCAKCELPRVWLCGGVSSGAEPLPPVEPYEGESEPEESQVSVANGPIAPAEPQGSESSGETQVSVADGPSVPQQPELSCPSECYCETSNENWEYLQRINELSRPIDLFLVIDATESTWQELAEFTISFEEFASNFNKRCVFADRGECLRVGALIFGGGADSSLKEGLAKQMRYSRNEFLETKSVGYVSLKGDSRSILRLAELIKGLAYIEEKEPWLDALFFATNSANTEDIGWRTGWGNESYKVILLITDEPSNSDVHSIYDVTNTLGELKVNLYALVENIEIGMESAEATARRLTSEENIYRYSVSDNGVIVSNNQHSSFPMNEAMKRIIKDIVEDLMLEEKNRCESPESCERCTG